MATKKYTSISDIKETWINNIAPTYFNFNNTNNYQSGIFGYINEVMGNTTEDSFNAINIARREFYPISAQNKQSLYKMATLQKVDLPMVTPGTANAILLIPVSDIINASTYSAGIYTCTIDNSLGILADTIPFILEYPIIIISKKSGSGWIHTSHYDISVSSSLDNSSDRYITNKTIIENGVSYLLLSVTLKQAQIQNITQVITKDSMLDTTTLDFTFDGDLAQFEVFYSENSGDTESQLKKVLSGGASLQVPFCYYELVDASTIRLTFPPNSYFTPAFNSEIRLAVYTSMGESGNFESFTGSLTCSPNSDTHPENNTMLITGVINGACTGGAAKASDEEFRQTIINAYSTNNTITTSNDLQIYFDALASQDANAKNNKMLFRKKRDDALIRLYGAYAMIKDSYGNVVPTNTLNINFKHSWLTTNMDENRLFIKPGTLFEYEPNTSTINYETTPVSEDDITITSDLDVYDNNTAILYSGVYANNIFVVVGSNGAILTSTNGTSWTKRVVNITNHLFSICYGNSLFVAVGDTGTIITSADGIAWTSRVSGTTKYLRGVSYCNSKFIAVGDNGALLISDDATTWATVDIPTAIPTLANISLRKAIYANSVYIIVGDNGTMITYSGTNILQGSSWSVFSTTTLNSNQLFDIIWDGSKFIAVGVNGTVLTGTNNTIATWSVKSSFTTYTLYNINYVNGMYILCGMSGVIMTSTDFTTWTNRSSSNSNNLYSTMYGQSIYVAIGDSGTILNSTNGSTWTIKPIRFLFTNTFLIALNLNPNVVGHYLNSINSSRSVSYTYINNNTLMQFISSSLKIKRNALMKENFYKFTIYITPASDLDPTTTIVINDPTLATNQIRASKNGTISSIVHNGTNVIANIKYTDDTTDTISISSYSTYADGIFTYHTGYNMNFAVGDNFVVNDILATKKVDDLGKIRAAGDFNGLLSNNNMYIPFYIENYDATNNIYELSSYISTNDVMTLDATLLIVNGIYRSDGSENDNVSIPMNNLDMDVHIFFKNDNTNPVDHKYSNFEYMKAYTLTNTYTNAEATDNDKIALIHQIDFIRSTATFSEISGVTDDYMINISEVPMAQASWCKTYSNFEYLINTIYQDYLYLYEAYFLLENNFGIDLKYYNTYGKSKFFKVGIKSDTSILDNINCVFSFGIYLTTLTSTDIFITKFRTWIKDYVESTNYVSTSGQSIYILNMIADAKTEFSEIGYIEYYGFNSYSYKAQKIEGLTNDQISASGLREYIPEFINIRSTKDGDEMIPKINITLLDQ